MEARAPFEFVDFESTSSERPLAHHVYKTLFLDNKYGDGSMISPRSIFRMRVDKAEVPWSDIQIEIKSQRHLAFDKWVGWVFTDPEVVKLFNKISIKP